MSAFRRSVPFIAGGALLAATALATAGCSATAEAAPISAAASTTSISASPSPSPARTSAGPPAAPSTAPRTSAAAPSPSAKPSVKPSPSHTAVAATTSSPSRGAALKAEGVPCDATAAACVSLSKQEAWLIEDGKVVYGPVPVATGRASLPTPTGDFHVFYKEVDGWSRTYDAPMPYSIYFYKGDAFHEDPVTVRSHGCVHLTLSAAKFFYGFLHYGAKVEVRY